MKTTEVMDRTGATYRQLDFWARIGLIKPAARAAMGSGTRREYSNGQVDVIAILVDLLRLGWELRRAAAAAQEIAVTGRTSLTGALVAVEAWKK